MLVRTRIKIGFCSLHGANAYIMGYPLHQSQSRNRSLGLIADAAKFKRLIYRDFESFLDSMFSDV